MLGSLSVGTFLSRLISLTNSFEVDRVRWFRTRAAHDRCEEKLQILNEEFSRTYCSFTKMSNIWKKIGDKQFNLRKNPPRLGDGYRAFAYRQATMYTKLAKETVDHWNSALE